jgi:DNA-binding protein HU-beta
MTEKMSKHEILSQIAEKTGVTRKVAGEVVDALVELAYKEARHQFTIPGLGVITLSDRAARKMVMRFGPKAGQEIEVPAKKVLKFRFAKAAKEAIVGPRASKKAVS